MLELNVAKRTAKTYYGPFRRSVSTHNEDDIKGFLALQNRF